MTRAPARSEGRAASARAAADSRPAVACQALTKVFKDFWMRDRARAVDDVTFRVDRGEIFGLLGPNGSGKSTTIKIMLGLLRPTSGRIAVFGKPPTDVKTKARIGYLPEESYLYGFLDARETLDYYGKLFQLDPRTRKARIDELLDMVGLTAAANRPVRDYSKGMQRRIGIAQALINDPDLLILDEPTTGLDPLGTRQVKDLILELGRRGKTVILSSHLLADVEDVVDRMVILYGGRVRGEGTCDALLSAHDRTIVETDDLDEGTLAEIDRVIRERTHGEGSVRRVSKPRQRLEELFLDIVARAQAERVSTSGADNAGATASFLRADEERGEAVIDRLLEEEALEPASVEEAEARVHPDGTHAEPEETAREDDETIAALLGESEPAGPGSEADEHPPSTLDHPESGDEPRRPAPDRPPQDVDEDVIGSLIEGGERDDDAADDVERGGGRR